MKTTFAPMPISAPQSPQCVLLHSFEDNTNKQVATTFRVQRLATNVGRQWQLATLRRTTNKWPSFEGRPVDVRCFDVPTESNTHCSCRFCHEYNPRFTQPDVLQKHYVNKCPMLQQCAYCAQGSKYGQKLLVINRRIHIDKC